MNKIKPDSVKKFKEKVAVKYNTLWGIVKDKDTYINNQQKT